METPGYWSNLILSFEASICLDASSLKIEYQIGPEAEASHCPRWSWHVQYLGQM